MATTAIPGRYRFDLPEGTVWLTVTTAKVETRGTVWDGDRREVAYPKVRVHTTEVHSMQDDAPGYVKIRGRQYLIDTTYRLVPEAERRTYGDGRVIGWEHQFHEAPGQGAFRNADGRPVGWDTKARGQLDEIVKNACSALDAEHPEWRIQSVRAYLERERSSHETRIARGRAEIAAAEDEIRKLDARIEELTAP